MHFRLTHFVLKHVDGRPVRIKFIALNKTKYESECFDWFEFPDSKAVDLKPLSIYNAATMTLIGSFDL